MPEHTETDAIADLALKSAVPPQLVMGQDGRRFLVTPSTANVREVDYKDEHGLLPMPPERIHQSVIVQTTDSLVDYVDRFKTADTVLFADIAANRIRGLIDYHAPHGEVGGFLDHAATLDLPFSEEWRTWSGASGKLMEQLAFARFLEENGGDVTAPDGAELLEVCRDLQAHRKVNFIKAVRTSSDNENFEYTDETEARSKRGDIEIPSKFELALPVYFGEPTTKLFAFLRWTLTEGDGLKLGFVLHRAEHVRQAIFKQIVLNVGERTAQPIVFGREA